MTASARMAVLRRLFNPHGGATAVHACGSIALLCAGFFGATAQAGDVPPGADASIDQALTAEPGDATRGRAIVANRQLGLCLLCHSAPIPEERFQGTLAPDLAGTGARWREGQLRQRLVDSRRIDPHSMMPAYFRADGFERVGSAWRGKTVLNAQQIEDVVAYLRTLQ